MQLRINILLLFFLFQSSYFSNHSEIARFQSLAISNNKLLQEQKDTLMADFNKVVDKTFKFEGGFQQYPTDKGNYNSLGQLIGTNHGISAIALEQYIGRPTTVEDIKNLTISDAKKVYKKLFWDKIRGDEIKNQDVAFIIFQNYIGSPANSHKILKRALKTITGKDYTVKAPYPDDVIKAINRSNSKKLFYAIKEEKRKYLESLRVKYPEYINGWLNRLNSHEYLGNKKKLIIVSGILLISSASLFFLYKKGKLSFLNRYTKWVSFS